MTENGPFLRDTFSILTNFTQNNKCESVFQQKGEEKKSWKIFIYLSRNHSTIYVEFAL